MIRNDQELEGTQQRIADFQGLLAQLRVAARVQEFPSLQGAYVAEVERMHREVTDYLTHHASIRLTPEVEGASVLCADAPHIRRATLVHRQIDANLLAALDSGESTSMMPADWQRLREEGQRRIRRNH